MKTKREVRDENAAEPMKISEYIPDCDALAGDHDYEQGQRDVLTKLAKLVPGFATCPTDETSLLTCLSDWILQAQDDARGEAAGVGR